MPLGRSMFPLREHVERESEYVRCAKFLDVEGSYELEITPGYFAQAVGSCCGVDFYFRGKYGEWEFETQNEVGHPFPPDDPFRFSRTGEYKAVTITWATRCLQNCLAEMCMR